MKKIIGTYGTAIVAISVMSVVSICIMVVLFAGEGKGNAIAVLAQESISQASNGKETGDAFSQYRERRKPEILNGQRRLRIAKGSGRSVTEVVKLLEGIKCGPRPTSCPDQLSKALKQAL